MATGCQPVTDEPRMVCTLATRELDGREGLCIISGVTSVVMRWVTLEKHDCCGGGTYVLAQTCGSNPGHHMVPLNFLHLHTCCRSFIVYILTISKLFNSKPVSCAVNLIGLNHPDPSRF